MPPIQVPQEPQNIANVSATAPQVETIASSAPNELIPTVNSPAGTSGTTTPATPGSTIRNISQTVQEREIIKTAPDLVVYLEGFPYLVNYFISDESTNNPYTVVQFNDYVTSFNAGYDTENLIPAASIQIQVPNHAKHLFQMPGGNNLIQTMMQVQVFAKGYFFGNDGSTLLRRVFKGIISHISTSDDGKMFQIQLQCTGILKMLELMQVELSPAVISNAPLESVPTKTNLAFCNPYMMIVQMFIRRITTEGFQVNSVDSAAGGGGVVPNGNISSPSNPFNQAVVEGYVAKWQAILNGLKQDVHFYGVTFKDIAQNDPTNLLVTSPVDNVEDQNKRAAALDIYTKQSEAQQLSNIALATTADGTNTSYPAIRQYLPDMEISSIQLLNNKIINRIDEIRQVLHTILYEGYQDVDGKIIFKPPLYNLDVANDNIGTATNTAVSANTGSMGNTGVTSGTNAAPSGGINPTNSVTEITPTNNPFVVYLSEITNEQETEDQAAIRTTRMTVRGNWEPTLQFNGAEFLLDTVEYIDIPKLQKFGLREEPTKSVGWFRDGDKFGLFAYAASETVRANRGYRTYTFTIPMRPELKLGFPCFIPHRDMYGYIKSIQLQYNQGGAATMTVSLDALRRRPLIPTPTVNSKGAPISVLASQPNLVWQWTLPPSSTTATASPSPLLANATGTAQGANLTQGSDPTDFLNLAGTSVTGQPASSSTSNTPLIYPSAANPANIVNTPASVPLTPDQALSAQQQAILKARQTRIGNTWGTESDSSTACFRIQNDTYGPYIMPSATGQQGSYGQPNGSGVFVKQRVVDPGYYHDIRRTMPFTDGKGYEVVSPFPWGRYITLRQAVKEFTQDGYIVPPSTQPASDAYVPNDQVQALLAAGLIAPSGQGTTVEQIQTQMNAQSAVAPDYTIIVLNYSGPAASTPADSSLMTTAQPDVNSAIQQLQNTVTTQAQAIAVLVSGKIAPTLSTLEALDDTQTPSSTDNLGFTSAPPGSRPKGLPQFNTTGS
jgi:hypothetical protein